MSNKVRITDGRIKELGNKLSSVKDLDAEDQELLVATFALAGEAVTQRAQGPGVAQASRLGDGLVEGFRGSLGPQVGGTDPVALDVGVDINVNW